MQRGKAAERTALQTHNLVSTGHAAGNALNHFGNEHGSTGSVIEHCSALDINRAVCRGDCFRTLVINKLEVIAHLFEIRGNGFGCGSRHFNARRGKRGRKGVEGSVRRQNHRVGKGILHEFRHDCVDGSGIDAESDGVVAHDICVRDIVACVIAHIRAGLRHGIDQFSGNGDVAVPRNFVTESGDDGGI